MKLTAKQKGVIFILISAFGFAMMNLFVRLSGDLPSIQKSFFRNLIAFFVALIYLMNKKKKTEESISLPQGKKEWGILILRSFFGTIGIIANFYMLDRVPVADASVMNKLAPFFVVLLSFIFLHEKMNISQIFALICAFAGVIFVADPSFENVNSIYYLVGVFGGFSAGAAYTCLRQLGLWGVNGSFIICFFAGFSCIVTLPFLLFQYHPMTWTQIFLLLCTGCFAAIGQYGVTFAYRYAPGKEISIYDYSTVVFTAILGFLFLSEVPDKGTVIGSAMIFAASLAIFMYNKKDRKR